MNLEGYLPFGPIYLARHAIFYGEAAFNRPLNDLRGFDFLTVSAGIQYRF